MDKDKLFKILETLREGAELNLGDQLEGVYLFGSQARGDALPDSDIDILIVLHEEFNYDHIHNQLLDLTWKLSLDNDTVISLVLMSEEEFFKNNDPFLMNVHQEGKRL